MDDIAAININKDSNFAILLEAQSRGWQIYYMEIGDLYLAGAKACARTRALQVQSNPKQWYQLGEWQQTTLSDLDIVLMRKEPPCDQQYIYATYILEQAARCGLLVANRPQSLRDANEKLYTAWFDECCTASLVSANIEQIKQFLHTHQQIIIKPLDGMGGASIFCLLLGDSNTNVILETMTCHNSRYIMAQRYIPEIKDGDKRILLIDGEAVPYALARIPLPGENRGNLAAGASYEGRELTKRDRRIIAQIAPTLRAKGLLFVGIDIIGDFLTEINVTCPTCIQELDRLFGLKIAADLLDCLANKIRDN